MDQLTAFLHAHHAMLVSSLKLAAPLVALALARLALPALREKLPRVYALGMALVEVSPELRKAGGFLVAAVKGKAALDELEGIVKDADLGTLVPIGERLAIVPPPPDSNGAAK